MEDIVELAARKLLGIVGPSGTYSEALQWWLLKFGSHIFVCISVESFVDWTANMIPLWAVYMEFMSGHPIALDKPPIVQPMGVWKKWH